MNNWPSHVTKTRHLASRQNRPRLCLHFGIIKRASDGFFKRKQRNLLDNSPHSKKAQSRIRQASTQIKGQLTRQTNKPPRQVKENVRQTKHMVDCNDVICTWRISPWRIFRGGQICNDELPSKNPKNVDFDCIMKAFFDERNKTLWRPPPPPGSYILTERNRMTKF